MKTISGTYCAVGRLEDFPPQLGRVVQVEGRELAVFRTSDGQIYAVENRHPHPKGGPLAEGIVSGHILFDPLYDWKIDLETGLVQAPDTGQVSTYPVKLDNGTVLVAI
ncbi:nitrite reductase small subunit NirD [Paenibacillus ginsengihumi]|uniref:nitrite reductase small subunit NirD n=1 Tax=Paenibacillus ginsengihumi TaxID=431596 RepID=UPI000363B81F|nr:nitrite reductase small subunit NirD [Paenibacillus ginsengihumi]